MTFQAENGRPLRLCSITTDTEEREIPAMTITETITAADLDRALDQLTRYAGKAAWAPAGMSRETWDRCALELKRQGREIGWIDLLPDGRATRRPMHSGYVLGDINFAPVTPAAHRHTVKAAMAAGQVCRTDQPARCRSCGYCDCQHGPYAMFLVNVCEYEARRALDSGELAELRVIAREAGEEFEVCTGQPCPPECRICRDTAERALWCDHCIRTTSGRATGAVK